MAMNQLRAATLTMFCALLGACTAGGATFSPPKDHDAEVPLVDGSGLPVTCLDGLRNGDETHKDCGGSCGPCADGAQCERATDCVSGVCLNNYCLVPNCSDGVKNGAETQTDCGGDCGACANGLACAAASDCLSGVCTGGFCTAASCTDSVKNGNETDVDCGGNCDPCASGKDCELPGDCASELCERGMCIEASCNDLVRNGAESDVDCGGAECLPCADWRACTGDSDCLNEHCVHGSCTPPTCTDTIKNQDETDVDCGGNHCDPCVPGQACVDEHDCDSGWCVDSLCIVAPTCDDTIKNRDETDVDCGGAICSTRCADGLACTVGSDCLSGVCDAGLCQVPSCTDHVRNGTETSTDCGGPNSCPRCPDFKPCSDASDCSSAACTAGHCGTTGCAAFGSDTYGYVACSLTPGVDGLNCPDISTTGTAVTLGDDDVRSAPIGFSFNFYGTTYTDANINSNGGLTFGPVLQSELAIGNQCLPTTSLQAPTIAAFWDDLYPPGTGNSVKYQTLGSAPNRQFVVRYDVDHYSSTPTNAVFTIVLNETTNDISVCYADTDFGTASYNQGLNATSGISNGGMLATQSGAQYSCNTATLTDGLQLEYHHP